MRELDAQADPPHTLQRLAEITPEFFSSCDFVGISLVERDRIRTPVATNEVLRELDEARDWMVTLGRRTAAEKVASFLLMIARKIDPAEAGQRSTAFDLPLSRAEIADFLGLTIETVSRQFTRLRSDGVIRIEHTRHVIVDDLGRLAARAGG